MFISPNSECSCELGTKEVKGPPLKTPWWSPCHGVSLFVSVNAGIWVEAEWGDPQELMWTLQEGAFREPWAFCSLIQLKRGHDSVRQSSMIEGSMCLCNFQLWKLIWEYFTLFEYFCYFIFLLCIYFTFHIKNLSKKQMISSLNLLKVFKTVKTGSASANYNVKVLVTHQWYNNTTTQLLKEPFWWPLLSEVKYNIYCCHISLSVKVSFFYLKV